MSFEIKETKLTGKGLFAQTAYEKDQPIMKLEGRLVSLSDVEKMNKSQQDNVCQIGAELYLDMTKQQSFFVNHSCNANAGIKILHKQAFLAAIKPIKKGEEITFDYSTTSTDTEDDWQMKCLCGSWNCRKKVSGFSYLKKEEKEYYLSKGVVPVYLTQKS